MINTRLLTFCLLLVSELSICQSTTHATKIQGTIPDSLLVPYRKNGKWGYAKLFTKEIVIPPKYEYPFHFKNGLVVAQDERWKTGLINSRGDVVIPLIYDFIFPSSQEGVYVAQKDKHDFLLISTQGAPLTKSYEFISLCANHFGVMLNGKWGIIDIHENLLVPCEYDFLQMRGDDLYAEKNKKQGYIRFSNTTVIPVQYDWVGPLSDGIALAKSEGKFRYVTSKAEYTPNYEEFRNFHEGRAIVKKNNLSGVINTEFKEVLPPQYEFISDYSDGLAVATLGGKSGYLDKNGEVIIDFIFENAYPFKSGFAGVKKNGRWGFIDKKGKQVVDCIYKSVIDFNRGYAFVRVDDNWGLIDIKGNMVVTPKNYRDITDYSFFNGLIFEVGAGGWLGFVDVRGNEYWEK